MKGILSAEASWYVTFGYSSLDVGDLACCTIPLEGSVPMTRSNDVANPSQSRHDRSQGLHIFSWCHGDSQTPYGIVTVDMMAEKRRRTHVKTCFYYEDVSMYILE